jgi:3-hydroxyacyl-CoA dehydrogenase
MIDYELAEGVCVLRLSAPPLNTLTLALLESLRAALRRAIGDAAVRGIVITGGPEHFSAGADVNLFREIKTAQDAIRTSRVFQEAFGEVEDCPKPVVAALAGTVVGGAVELAAACHFRIAAETTRFRMPEVTLGINPGSGGTQRLPRLVGIETALKMLLTAETIDADKALALGLIDAVCPRQDLMERAAALLRGDSSPRKTSRRTDRLQDAAANEAAFHQAQELISRMRPEVIAPRKIVEAVWAGMEDSVQAGLRKEQEAFAECMATLATQNKIYLFFATRQTGKLSELEGVEPPPVRQAAVVGVGTMGSGIAQAMIAAGLPVVALDQSEAALAKGIERIRGSVQRRVAQGRLSQEEAAATLRRISSTTRWQDLARADLVVESVFEDAEAKRAVFKCLEEVCRPQTILATNTSTLSLDVLAAGMKYPERLIGLHFFHPAQRMPLLEVVRRPDTPPEIVAAAVKLAKTLGKTPVVVRNREGFLVNRIFVPYLQEAFWLLEEGAAAPEIDNAAVDFGFPMGPLALIDMSGLDILVHAQRGLAGAFPWHGRLSEIALRLVERWHLGQKTGAGVYRYEPGDHRPHPSELAGEVIAELQRAAGLAPRRVEKEEIAERLVLRMVGEAYRVLEEGIVRSASDLDVAMVLGVGFPDFRGGPLKYSRDLGLDKVRARLQELAAQCGPRFEPCELLLRSEER